MTNLTNKVLAAAQSNYLGMVVRVAAQLIAQIAILRMLGPELVGTFGYVLLLHGVLALVIDQGFGWSLIQGDFGTEEVAVAFTRLLLAGAVASAGVYASSYPIALWLENPLAGEVLRWSAPAYLTIAFYAISHAKLRRDLRFREVQYATNGAYVIAYPGVGLALAWWECGIWSLVAAWYCQSLLQIFIGHYYSTHSLRLIAPWRTCKAGPLGRQVASINVLNWLVDNGSGFAVGTMGAHALGSYNAGAVLARQPAMQLLQTLQGLLFATASAMNDERARVRKLYLASLASVALLMGPFYGFLLSRSDLLVELLLGEEWLVAGTVLAALSLGMATMAMSMVASSILTATSGRLEVLTSQIACLAILMAGLVWATGRSVEAVAWTVTVAYVVRFCWQVVSVVQRGIVSWSDVGLTLRGPLLLSLLFALPVSTWMGDGGVRWIAEGFNLLLMVCGAALLLRWRVRFFVAPMLIKVLADFGAGRKLLRILGADRFAS